MEPLITIAITAACFSGDMGGAAMLQSSIKQLRARYGKRLRIKLMSARPAADRLMINSMPEEYDFIRVINTKPLKLLLLAFPLAILYSFMRFIPPLKWLLERNSIIKAYSQTDMVLDEAGISFSDSRGFAANAYSFIGAAVPMLCGVPAVKYSQTLGTFKKGGSKVLARWILPRMRLICVRGEHSRESLAQLGITENVRVCADGAFSMPESEHCAQQVRELCESDDFYKGRIVALAPSSAAIKRYKKLGRDYSDCMTRFADSLTERGFNVLIIASSAREGSEKNRGNDLPICGEVYEAVSRKDMVRYYPREMPPEEISGLLGRCECVVTWRFSAVIGALAKHTPALLVGCTHEGMDALDMFGLGEYAVDYAEAAPEALIQRFDSFCAERGQIREKIAQNLPEAVKSSEQNIALAAEELDKITASPKWKEKKDEPIKDTISRKKLLKVFKIAFAVLVVVFLAWYFWKNREDFASIQSVDLKVFVLSMLFYFVYKFTLASLWHYLTKINGCAIKYEKAVTSYLYSILGKYIPGKVFMLAARLTYYKEEDAPLSKVTVCFFIENVCTLLGAAMLFIVSLFFFPNELLENYKWLTVLLIIAFFVCINPKIINFFLKLVGKLFKKDLQIPMKYSQMIKVVLLFIGNWLIVGVGFYMLVQSIYPDVLPEQLLFCAGIWGVSAIMGILAIFAPSGIGVREGIIVAGLSLIMPVNYAMVISVVSRLWQTIPELLLVLMAFVWSRIRNMSKIKLKQPKEKK